MASPHQGNPILWFLGKKGDGLLSRKCGRKPGGKTREGGEKGSFAVFLKNKVPSARSTTSEGEAKE